MTTTLQILEERVGALENQIKFVTRSIVNPQEATMDKLLAELWNYACYTLLREVQKSPLIQKKSVTRRITHNERIEDEEHVKQGPLTESFIRVRVHCSFRVFVTLCHSTNSLLSGLPRHYPVFRPSIPFRNLTGPLQEAYAIHFPTLAGFSVSIGMSNHIARMNLLCREGKAVRLAGTLVRHETDSSKPAFFLPGLSQWKYEDLLPKSEKGNKLQTELAISYRLFKIWRKYKANTDFVRSSGRNTGTFHLSLSSSRRRNCTPARFQHFP